MAALWERSLPLLAQSAGLAIAGAVGWLLARWLLRRVHRHVTSRTATEVDDHLVRLLRSVVSISIVMFVLWRIAGIWEAQLLSRGLVGTWIVILSFPLATFVSSMLEIFEERVAPRTDTQLDDTALPLINKMIRFVVVAMGVVLALSELGIDITPFVAGAGVAGVAVSLAAKDTLSNLIAGILLIVDRPFQVGDRIELWQTPTETGTWGDVVEIGLRATKIRNPDNLIFVVPNNEIMRRDIVNYTASGNHIRVRIPIDIAYDADAHKAKEIVRRIAAETEGVEETPEPRVIIRRFGESGVALELRVWIAEARRRRAVGDSITDRVKHAFDEEGIEIPYPKRDLYIRSGPDGEHGHAALAARAAGRDADPSAEPSRERALPIERSRPAERVTREDPETQSRERTRAERTDDE